MNMNKILSMLLLILATQSLVGCKDKVGERIFFDTNLSSPPGQSCASCHDPEAGFADPDASLPVSRGAHQDRFGKRNAPSITYAAFTPAFHFDEGRQRYLGGQFVDGSAADLVEQAKGPFLNPLEMANPDKATVIEKIRISDYAVLFELVYGKGSLNDVDKAFDQVADALAAFQQTRVEASSTKRDDFIMSIDVDSLDKRVIQMIRRSKFAPLFERVFGAGSLDDVDVAFGYLTDALTVMQQSRAVLPFSSKFDAFLAGQAQLSEQEMRGFQLFDGRAECNVCHQGDLFTDHSYRNIGTPSNPDNPFYALPPEFNPDGAAFVDLGLGANPAVMSVLENGKFKVSTLRNVAATPPYMHNGVFQTLEEVVDFYNTRDVDPRWAPPEVTDNIETDLVGNLGLTQQEVADIVAFLKTLTDGYVVPN